VLLDKSNNQIQFTSFIDFNKKFESDPILKSKIQKNSKELTCNQEFENILEETRSAKSGISNKVHFFCKNENSNSTEECVSRFRKCYGRNYTIEQWE
jgi:hypothetical protein